MSEASASSTDDADDGDGGEAPSTQTHTGPGGMTTITRDGHGGVKTVTIGPDGSHTTVSTTSRDDEPPSFRPDGMHGFHSWMVIVAMVLAAGIIRTAIRARHGDFRTNRQRRRDERAGVGFVPPVANRENEALAEENAKLRAQATRMEERIAVLERIVTDPAKRVADEIDALR